VPEVRLIDDQGQQVGVLKTADALRFAQERDLDLVEVAPDAHPPVCRVLDYSKYKYEQAQKVKQARKHQQQITIREIKFRPKIAQHDFDTKKGHVERFLRNKDKVKVTIMFRGREVTHPERGVAILDRLAEELAPLSVVEQRPMQDGRNMTMMLGPSKAVLAGRAGEVLAGADGDRAARTPNGGRSAPDEEQPENAAEQPGTAAEQSATAAEESDAAAEQPDAGAEQPETAAEQPGTAAEQPGTAAEQSDVAGERSDAAPEQSGAAAEQSGTAAEQSAQPNSASAGEEQGAASERAAAGLRARAGA
jgi:translation initiation factor IF-3